MTHQGEDTFQDRVVSHLEDEYGSENVEEDKYLPDPYSCSRLTTPTSLKFHPFGGVSLSSSWMYDRKI